MNSLWYWDKNRVISLSIVCVYMILALFIGGQDDFIRVLLFSIFPLSCIWFGDELGGFTGFVRFHRVSQSPGFLIRFIGWVLLLIPGIFVIIAAIYFVLGE